MSKTKVNYVYYSGTAAAELDGEHAHMYVYDDDTDLITFDRILAVPLRNIVDIESTDGLVRMVSQSDDQTDVSTLVYVQ